MSHFGANIKKIRGLKKLSQAAFSDIFKLTRSSVAAYEEGRAEPKYEVAQRIAKHYNLTLDQLLGQELSVNTLSGFDLFRKDLSPGGVTHNLIVGGKGLSQMAFVGSAHQDDYIANFIKEGYVEQLPELVLPNPHRGTVRAFENSGHEMLFENRGISNGDIVIGKAFAKNNIQKSPLSILYIIVTEEGIFVRRLISKGTTLAFGCDNPQYAPLLCAAKNLLEIWEVKAVLSSNLQAPSNWEERLERIEKQLK